MHRCIFVLVNPPVGEATLEDRIEAILEPFSESRNDGPGHFDWFQIGGRWTGKITGYDPEKDPANIVTCELCAGTGTRPGGRRQFGEEWFKACGGCNGCHGRGKTLAHPTEWKAKGSLAPVATVLRERRLFPTAIVTPDGEWHELDWDSGDMDEKEPKGAVEILGRHREATAVTVDIHY